MPDLAVDPVDLARMGVPPEDWQFYQVESATGPSAPIPEAVANDVDAYVQVLLNLGIPLATAIPLAVDLYTNSATAAEAAPATEATALAPSEAEAIAQNLPEPEGQGTGLGGRVGGENPAGWGTLSEAQRSALSLSTLGLRGVGLVGTLAGVPALGLAPQLGAPITAALMADKIAGWLGAPEFTANPLAGAPTEADIQGARDLFGEYAAQDLAAERAAAINAATERAQEDWGINPATPSDLAGNPAGWAGDLSGPPAPSVAPAPGSPNEAEATGYDQGMGGGGYSSSTGGESPGPGGGYGSGGEALGGVHNVNRPTRALYGEAGPETAIFVPETMRSPGLQPNEQAVRRALAQSLLRLILSDDDLRNYAGRV